VDFTVVDASGQQIGGTYAFRDANAKDLKAGPFCGKSGADVPDGTVKIDIWLGVADPNSPTTPPCATPVPGMTGTVTFSGSGVALTGPASGSSNAPEVRTGSGSRQPALGRHLVEL
jgi:hypothetical protein